MIHVRIMYRSQKFKNMTTLERENAVDLLYSDDIDIRKLGFDLLDQELVLNYSYYYDWTINQYKLRAAFNEELNCNGITILGMLKRIYPYTDPLYEKTLIQKLIKLCPDKK